ncbi:MAG TPA: hypothetical protein VMA83_00815 [Solirubrobacteraceae bacterium]|nr:hypothetical protein [Solirubrobacteraceae bacterium]
MLATAPASSAAVGHNSGAHQHGSQVKKQVTHFTATYDVPEYYGGVSCTGVHVVSAAFPGGKDIETCTSTEGKLSHMTTGTGQTTFANSSGGFTSGWDSDYDGVYTSDYTFSVNRKLTRFRLIAIFPAPES